MRFAVALLALGLVVSACSDPVATDEAGLVGSWGVMAPSFGQDVRMLTFTAEGAFTDRAGPPGNLEVVAAGRYRIDGNVLVFEEGTPLGMYAGGTFTIQDHLLTLDYVGWGPADEPFSATMQLMRMAWIS